MLAEVDALDACVEAVDAELAAAVAELAAAVASEDDQPNFQLQIKELGSREKWRELQELCC